MAHIQQAVLLHGMFKIGHFHMLTKHIVDHCVVCYK